ncbi:hypothetical protein OG453_39600 [Streptomyces sp. NBC_01381]|uniref:hypothetical protein n=1 Tax=Streptomyces sp. NBC_01381 TaxID=2903845 RepID=UPI002257D40F|nr:hypothetical protein [Streptomyces sp. NBC_01381]MCX4672682.1 hypothetical protein [Streptomyces sp. NBC_01381]
MTTPTGMNNLNRELAPITPSGDAQPGYERLSSPSILVPACIYLRLQSSGHRVSVVQIPLGTRSCDVDVLRFRVRFL